MATDKRIFRNAVEAIAAHDAALVGDAPDLYETRMWQAFYEENPGLSPLAVRRALQADFDKMEKMPPQEALDHLVASAGGKRPPPAADVGSPKEKNLWDPDTPLTLSDIIHKRAEGRRVVRKATEQEVFERRRAAVPLENARRELSRMRSEEAPR